MSPSRRRSGCRWCSPRVRGLGDYPAVANQEHRFGSDVPGRYFDFKPSDFQVGDRVEVTEHAAAHGRTKAATVVATIERVNVTTYTLRFDGGQKGKITYPHLAARRTGRHSEGLAGSHPSLIGSAPCPPQSP